MMSGTVFRVIGVMALVTASACKRADDRGAVGTDTNTVAAGDTSRVDEDRAMVRVVNALPGQATMDLTAGEDQPYRDVAFKTVTPYQTIKETRPKLTVVPSGQPNAKALAENTETVFDGRYYTVVVMSNDDGKEVEIKTLRDDKTPDDSTKARIRVVNAANRLKDIDIKISGQTDPLFDNLGFGDEEGFKEVEPGKVTLTVASEDTKQVLLQLADMELKAGTSVTLILVHTSAAGNKIEAIKVVDDWKAMPGRR